VVGRTQSVAPIKGTNPFLTAGENVSPLIPNLIGGAEAFGIAPGSFNDYASLAAAVGQPIPGSVGALVRLDGGLTGLSSAVAGFDLLAFVNLTAEELLQPMLGAGFGGDLSALVAGGFSRSPDFNPLATGPERLGSLAAGQVYVTLIPEGVSVFSVQVGGSLGFVEMPLGDGEAIFIAVPEPSALTLLLTATFIARFGWQSKRIGSIERNLRSQSHKAVSIDPVFADPFSVRPH